MKTFLEINRMIADQGYGRFLSFLLVNKALEVMSQSTNTKNERLVEFNY